MGSLVATSLCGLPRRSWGGRRGVPAGAGSVRVDLRRRRPTHRIAPGTAAAAVDLGRVLRPMRRPTDGRPRSSTWPRSTRRPARSTSRGHRRQFALHVADLIRPATGARRPRSRSSGALTGTDRTALARAAARADLDLPARPRPGPCCRGDRGDFRVELPIAPMLGTVGVAPAGRRCARRSVPDKFGGNMDTPECAPDHGLPGGGRRGRAVLRRRRASGRARGRAAARPRGRDGRDPDRVS